jgi:hypothetical protein
LPWLVVAWFADSLVDWVADPAKGFCFCMEAPNDFMYCCRLATAERSLMSFSGFLAREYS